MKPCGAFEHDIWFDLIEGNFEVLHDPATENPGTAYSPGTLIACNDITKTMFDMEIGVSKYFLEISQLKIEILEILYIGSLLLEIP